MARCCSNVLIGGRAAIQGSDVRVALLTPDQQHYVTTLKGVGAIFGPYLSKGREKMTIECDKQPRRYKEAKGSDILL